ncbi:hypothetical protein A628_02351 [Salmonella enterica subsp. enterica serovar Cubana str. 76814]|uniref:Uncharacterized protein n=1 Tax=Salmonella enterica subsp. enterica serovar Cubana str. 76814 TaxID=1192560 RepID=V7INA0_SALET|nr:hypothetical protein A628_02351 [Salmonella enterica subsp. enterica serovar Cubana str. 76814]
MQNKSQKNEKKLLYSFVFPIAYRRNSRKNAHDGLLNTVD